MNSHSSRRRSLSGRRSSRPCPPSGTGKSHFAEAICHAAIDVDLRASWFTLESLTVTIVRSRVDATTGKVVASICFSELIVVTDIGLLPAGEDEAEALYRLIDAAYEKRSLILTSDLHPGASHHFSQGPGHRGGGPPPPSRPRGRHQGQSKRLADALEGKGVTPLSEPMADSASTAIVREP